MLERIQTIHSDTEHAKHAREFLYSLLPYGRDSDHFQTLQLQNPEHIYMQLELSNKFRLGEYPSGTNRERGIQIVQKSINEQANIPILLTIGTSKWYDGSHADQNIAGLSELLMLEQLYHLDRRVKQLYQKGISVSLLAEDVTNQWLYGLMYPHVDVAINNLGYLSSLSWYTNSIRATTGFDIQLKLERDILQDQGMSAGGYIDICESNRQHFSNYFIVSQILEEKYLSSNNLVKWTDEHWDIFVETILSKTHEYEVLQEIGWKGPIHPQMKSFYLHQFEKSAGFQANTISYLAAYFGGVLARRQMNMLRSAASHGQDFIKIAFLRYPKGSTVETNTAIQISQHPLTGYGSSHQHISPWASRTQVVIGKNKSSRLRVLPAKQLTSIDNTETFQFYLHGMHIPVEYVLE